jgi:hypothetical protein
VTGRHLRPEPVAVSLREQVTVALLSWAADGWAFEDAMTLAVAPHVRAFLDEVSAGCVDAWKETPR